MARVDWRRTILLDASSIANKREIWYAGPNESNGHWPDLKKYLLDEKGYEVGLKYLAASRFEPIVVHVLDPAEIRAEATGPFIMVDLEDGGTEKIAVTPQLREKYNWRMEAFIKGAESFCRRQQIEYVPALTTSSFEDIVLRYLRSGAFVH